MKLFLFITMTLAFLGVILIVDGVVKLVRFHMMKKRRDEENSVLEHMIGPSPENIIEIYDDGVKVGDWGIHDATTGETQKAGFLMQKTVKYRTRSGEIKIGKMVVPERAL